MKEYWLNKKNNKDLIIFFTGWGMDHNPFKPLKCNDLDILIFYDYSDLKLNNLSLNNIINSEKYLNIYLIGFSLGVGALGYLLSEEIIGKVKRVIAINGTLEPIDDEKGIPRQIFENTIKFWDSENKTNFIRRMCRDQDTINKYHSILPKRTLSEELDELQARLSKALLKGDLLTGDNSRFLTQPEIHKQNSAAIDRRQS